MAGEGKKLAITDPESGEIVRVRWYSDSNPTDEDISSILSSYRQQAPLKPLTGNDVAKQGGSGFSNAWNKVRGAAENVGQGDVPFVSSGARGVGAAMSGMQTMARPIIDEMAMSPQEREKYSNHWGQSARAISDLLTGAVGTASAPFAGLPKGANEAYGTIVEGGRNLALKAAELPSKVPLSQLAPASLALKMIYHSLSPEDQNRVNSLIDIGGQGAVAALLGGAIKTKGGIGEETNTGSDAKGTFVEDAQKATEGKPAEALPSDVQKGGSEVTGKLPASIPPENIPIKKTEAQQVERFTKDADNLGIKFNSFQKVKDGEPLPLFTDTEGTGSTFVKGANETLEQAIDRSRGKFKSTNTYVDDTPLKIEVSPKEKQTARDIRYAVSGKYNAQVVTGNQVGDNISRALKSTGEDSAVWFYNEAHGDMARLQKVLDDPDPKLDPYREDIKKAMNLSDRGKSAYDITRKFYDEGGQYSLKNGTIKNVIEDYAGRLYEPTKEGKPSSEINSKGLSKFTRHTLERKYTGDLDVFDAIKNGLKPLTTKASENLSIWNQEMARVNTNVETARALQTNGLGGYKNVGDVPEGFKAVPGLDKLIPIEAEGSPAIVHKQFVVPEKLYDGMKALFEPDYLKKVPGVRAIMELQSMRKIGMFAFSLFHDYALTTQILGNTKGGVDMLRNLDDFNKIYTDEFNQREKFGAQHGLMTSEIERNQDIMRELIQPSSAIGKAEKVVANLPGIKQGIDLAKWKTDLTFGKLQRWAKVNDFTIKAVDYEAKNPKASTVEKTKALRDIAREVNANYGGLNWKALGATPTMLTTARFLALAPDWSYSNVEMVNIATKKGYGGSAARGYWATYLLGGIALTEALNKAFTGHYTDKNPKGHEFEVEAQPGVWVSVFRGAAGDAVKAYSMTKENGLMAGAQRFAMGKSSPLVSTAIGLAPGSRNYQGRQIVDPKAGSGAQAFQAMKFVVENMSPIPISGSGVYDYMKNNEKPTTLGAATVATGLGRAGVSSKDNIAAARAKRRDKNKMDKLKIEAEKNPVKKTLMKAFQ